MASVVILERGMTAATFDAYLESEPRVAALAGMLSDDVDGDLLIDVIQAAECADGRALQQYFSEDATIGLLGKLAIKLDVFAKAEKKLESLKSKEKKRDRDELRQERLAVAIQKEQEARVSGETCNLLLQAHAAAAEAAIADRAVQKQKKFEENGHEFTVTLNQAPQPHGLYLLDNLKEVLADMAPTDSGLPGAKLIGKPQKVLKKGRKKGAVKELKTELRVWVPGHVLAATFEERKKAGADLLLENPQGPYWHVQFMAYVSQHMAESTVKLNKLVADTASAKLREMKAAEVAKVTAAGAREVASANDVLSKRLMDKEAAKDLLTGTQKEALVAAARLVVKQKEDAADAAIDAATTKWDKLIEQRVVIEEKARLKQQEAADAITKAKQRKRDREEQATRAVQRDVLANAAKRARTEEPAKFSGANLSGAYAAAAYGAWLRSQGSTEPAEPAVVPRPEPADAAERVHAAGVTTADCWRLVADMM